MIVMRTWIGVALLAGSWLLGLGYYYPANGLAWALLVVAGVAMLGRSMARLPGRRDASIALVLLLPAVCFAPWPYRAAPLLIEAGLVLRILPIPRRWPRSLACGGVSAGVVMLVQWLTLSAYTAETARCHDLPPPLPAMLAALARLLGAEAVADGPNVVIHSLRQVHRLGATWELLLDPVTLCFFTGSAAVLGLAAWATPDDRRRWAAWIAALRTLALVVAAWLPIRVGLLMGVYLDRVLRADDLLPLHVMNLFLSPWVLLLLLLGPLLLAWRFVRLPPGEPGTVPVFAERKRDHPLPQSGRPAGDRPSFRGAKTGLSPSESRAWHFPAAAVLVLLAVGMFTVAVHWDPVGPRKAGRVIVVERHSTWEPTEKPYDTKWFGHDAGYNYAAIYAYCAQYYQMSRLLESDAIDDRTLAECDVLVIKVPTARYSTEEVAAVVRFVRRGGGLLLIGEHTNFEATSTYLNDITRQMGFTFRHDLLFGTGHSPYDQLYRPPRVPHPVVQHVPPMHFAVSCSIDPGRSRGRAVIRSTGLWSQPSDYHLDNYHPFPQLLPQIRYGAFIQLWSTRLGKGRVLAFTDSTIFSNFCTFQDGKAELIRGMLEWLNHGGTPDPRIWLLLLGAVPLAAGLYFGRGRPDAWMVLLAAGACGWALASWGTAAMGRSAMPIPPRQRPITRVAIERTVSEVPLSKSADIQGDGEGYGLLEQWISRLGCFTTRRSGPEVFDSDLLVVLCPSRSVSPQYRDALVRYVTGGGKLLVIDTPENTGSTANSLLWPFGLSVLHGQAWQGTLTLVDSWPQSTVEQAREIAGGRPVARLGRRPVAAVARHGKGVVMAVGFGSFFNDASMGSSWMREPDAETLKRYRTLFALVRSLLTDKPVAAPEDAKAPHGQ